MPHNRLFALVAAAALADLAELLDAYMAAGE